MEIWKQFEGICSVPHPSGHLDAIREHIKKVEGRLFKCLIASSASADMFAVDMGMLLRD